MELGTLCAVPPLLYLVSPHGFGHAARAAAVIEALVRRRPSLEVDIATTVPEWFFADSLSVPYHWHAVETDVGLVQRSPFEEDVAATAERLETLLGSGALERLASRFAERRPAAVVADIAPLGLELAARLRRPGVLVENFTWEFVYRAYDGPLAPWAERFGRATAGAGLRIQTEPWCEGAPGALRVAPVSRAPRVTPDAVRRRLGVAAGGPLVLVSMGGVPWRPTGLERLAGCPGVAVVVPGCGPEVRRRGSLVPLPHRSGFHHPDLVAAADLVVAKLGYSTLAEAWAAGTPIGYVPRSRFPESAVLARWAEQELSAARLELDELESGAWVERLDELLAMPRGPVRTDGGAGPAAAAILDLLDRS